ALAHVVFLPSRGDAPRRERPLLRAGVLLPPRLRAEHALPPRPSRAPWPAAPRPGEPPSPLHAALARVASLPRRGAAPRPERLLLRAGARPLPRLRAEPVPPPRLLRVPWPAALPGDALPPPCAAALARAVSLPPRGDVRRPERLPLRAGALLSPRPRGEPALPPRPLRVPSPSPLGGFPLCGQFLQRACALPPRRPRDRPALPLRPARAPWPAALARVASRPRRVP